MKQRIRIPRTVLLVATAGLASVTLNGCLFTSGNLVAPPPCDDAGNWECYPDAGQDAGRDGGRDAGRDGQDGGPIPDDAGPIDGGGADADVGDASAGEDAGDDAG